jgi:hypothetical protein
MRQGQGTKHTQASRRGVERDMSQTGLLIALIALITQAGGFHVFSVRTPEKVEE